MMESHSVLQADPAVPELVVRMAAAQAVAEVPLGAERKRMG
jgi:hypothetical protein